MSAQPTHAAGTDLTFSSSDNVIVRATNLWFALGFANDRGNMIPRLAGFLALYQDLDRKSEHLRAKETGT